MSLQLIMTTQTQQGPVLPRPDSLFVPDVTSNRLGMVDTSTYSPFPTFPGSQRARDPHGLNAFLLHPFDPTWSPAPPSHAVEGLAAQAPAPTEQRGSTIGRKPSLVKHRSLSMLRRPSPLSQPPVSAVEPAPVVSPRTRTRSNSADSVTRLSMEERARVVSDFGVDLKSRIPKSPGKKSLRKALHSARRNIFGSFDDQPAVPAIPQAILITAPIQPPSSMATDPATPMSSRSNSNYSILSSASSTSSSEGVKTPSEGSQVDVTIAGTKLADALLEVGDKKGKGKSWKIWLGGKRGSKLSFRSSEFPGASIPITNPSLSSSPNTSLTSLFANADTATSLTPSPVICPPGRSASTDTISRVPPVRTLTGEQLRRLSHRKMTQLHASSPHPLAAHFHRQQFNLPDEVALVCRAGKKVYPLSVNSFSCGNGLDPAQGGLWTGIAVATILAKLDAGYLPSGLLNSRPWGSETIPTPRIRGICDFLRRSPFEERNLVYFPDDSFSPISMARPGFGIWDLDFSAHIVALSEMEEPRGMWPQMPKESMGDMDEVRLSLAAVEELEMQEILTSPIPKSSIQEMALTLEEAAATLLEVAVGPACEVEPLVQFAARVPLGSAGSVLTSESFPAYLLATAEPTAVFKISDDVPDMSHVADLEISDELPEEPIAVWEASEDVPEAESDEEPLAWIVKKRSFVGQTSSSRAGLAGLTEPERGHIRARSQPGDDKESRRFSMGVQQQWEAVQQRMAQEEVTNARQRREQQRSGETERQAEADQMRHPGPRPRLSVLSNRSLMTELGPKNATDSSSRRCDSVMSISTSVGSRPPSVQICPASPRKEAQSAAQRPDFTHRRGVSQYDSQYSHRPPMPRKRSAPATGSGRYHSFYEVRGAPLPTGKLQGGIYPYSVMSSFPGMPMPSRPAMGFPTIPMPMPMTSPFVTMPPVNGFYRAPYASTPSLAVPPPQMGRKSNSRMA